MTIQENGSVSPGMRKNEKVLRETTKVFGDEDIVIQLGDSGTWGCCERSQEGENVIYAVLKGDRVQI